MIEISAQKAKNVLPKRKENSNKGDFGKAFCITGSNEYIGAGYLSAISALKVGVGYSILCSEDDAIPHYKKMSPDLIYKSHKQFDIKIVAEYINQLKPTAIVLGCGIGFSDKTLEFVPKIIELLKNKNIPTVLDADALNCIASLKLENLGANFILTPHPKELSRLLNIDVDLILKNREEYVRIAQEKYASTLILKGNETLICDLEKNIYINTSGNSALAKAGTGDVLAGMIGGFLAQNMSIKDATCLAVYLHGLSADIYKNQFSSYSMLASDLLNYIPIAIKQLLSHN